MRTSDQKAKRNQRIAIKNGKFSVSSTGRVRNASGVFVKRLVSESFAAKFAPNA